MLWLGDFEGAGKSFRQALEYEPLSVQFNRNYSEYLFYSGRLDEGEERTLKTLELDPNLWYTHYVHYIICRARGNYAKAADEFAKALELKGVTGTPYIVRESFSKGGWQGVLKTMTRKSPELKISPYDRASFHAELGETDQAFLALDEAFEKRDQFIAFLKVDPFFARLHNDPRFILILKKLGLAL